RDKTTHGALITTSASSATGAVRSRHCNSAWPMCAVLAATADPVRTRLRRNRRAGSRNPVITTIELDRSTNNRGGPSGHNISISLLSDGRVPFLPKSNSSSYADHHQYLARAHRRT